MGVGYRSEWLTGRDGTGKFKEYIYKYTCGATGSFSSAGHVYLKGGTAGTPEDPLTWYVAYSTTFDMTDVSDVITANENITGVSDAMNDYIEENNTRVDVAESQIEQLANSISTMVTDENGQSLMEQTSGGWTFNIGAIQSQIDEAAAGLDTVEKNLNSTTDMVNKANALLDDVTQKTAYINMATDDSGAPCIELGKQGNPFKLRITNTSIDFMQDNMRIAYITNRQLYIEKSVVTDEMKVGSASGFIWKKRANGNMGLRWVGE